MNKLFIAAVRNDSIVGKGSCSNIDECYDDNDLWDLIKDASNEKEAIKLARDQYELFLEQGLNQRWGEDDDPQLVWYNEVMADIALAEKEGR